MQATSDGQTGKKHNALGLVAHGMGIVGIKTTHADVSWRDIRRSRLTSSHMVTTINTDCLISYNAELHTYLSLDSSVFSGS